MSSYAVADPANSEKSEQQRSRKMGVLQATLVAGLCAVLALAILSFGAVDEWSTFAFEAGAAILFLVWAGGQLASGRITLSKNPLYLPALLFFGLIVTQIVLKRSAYGYITMYEALQYVAYGIMLLIAAECVRHEESRKIFTLFMVVFGALYAFFAVAQDLASNGKIFWIHRPHFPGSIYGSYVNHNHYAGLMEMLVPIPLVLTMGHMFKGGKRVLVGFCAVLMATTIFLSRSRGGMIAFVVEIALFAVLAFVQRKNPRVGIGLLAACVLVLGFLLFMGKGRVLGRLGDLAPGIRMNITKDSLRMFVQRPILGWGLGTFPTVYPTYRSFYTNLFINEAHNDYAQLLVETGVVGFGLMMWFLIAVYRRGLPKSRRWEFKWDGALSLAALLGCTGILLHSFVDFNLQIPANAALFFVLCALASHELPSESSRVRRKRTMPPEHVQALHD